MVRAREPEQKQNIVSQSKMLMSTVSYINQCRVRNIRKTEIIIHGKQEQCDKCNMYNPTTNGQHLGNSAGSRLAAKVIRLKLK